MLKDTSKTAITHELVRAVVLAARKKVDETCDPATGVMRHADAGYDEAVDCAREQGLDLPMI